MNEVDRRSLKKRVAALGLEPQKIRLIDPQDGFSSRPVRKSKAPPPTQKPSSTRKLQNPRPDPLGQARESELNRFVDQNKHKQKWILIVLSFFCSISLGAIFSAGMALAAAFERLWVYEPAPNIYLDRILRTIGYTPPTNQLVPYSIEGFWFFAFQILSSAGALAFLAIGILLIVESRLRFRR